eukprot:scaffold80008_cov47-Attheya_sp.AAC.5
MASCSERFGDSVDRGVAGAFSHVGAYVGSNPKRTLALSILVTALCGIGFLNWTTENRPEELWVPQGTKAQVEETAYLSFFPRTARFNTMIVRPDSTGPNILDKTYLEQIMMMHKEIETRLSKTDEIEYDFLDLCVKTGGTCASSVEGVCGCLVSSILRQWNYDLATLQADASIIETVNSYGSRADLEAILGNAVFDENDQIVSAEALSLSYFLADRSIIENGGDTDPINEAWEEEVFLNVIEDVAPTSFPSIEMDYLSSRSFNDEFGGAISGDLLFVQVSYFISFLFLGATLGKLKCGTGSRWTMALGALFMVVLSTGAGFGLSSGFGLFFGPVHSLLPFILLGIGVDDAFVIVNAFNRERKVRRSEENNAAIAKRSASALARAGASITVTSLTDLVAFAISSSSALPALSSFCGYAAICIFFLWFFAATFFSAAMVLDERRQRDNRRECLVCVSRKGEAEDEVFQEGLISKYFRNYHAPAILSKPGKVITLLAFAGLLAFGVFGALNLTVEDSERNFLPQDSYIVDYVDAADKYFPDQGVALAFVFEGSSNIYASRQSLAELETRLEGKSTAPPYIAEPVSEEAYRNVMYGLSQYLVSEGTSQIGNVALGEDGWPTTESDFVLTVANYTSFSGPGSRYAQDVSFSEAGTQTIEAFKVESEYVKLLKTRRGEQIDDAEKLIDAMDSTRDMVNKWDDLPSAFPYSDKFLAVEGFKIIRQELFVNVGLAIIAVGVIVFFTVASLVTAIVITLNVAFCIIEILGFMWAVGIVIDSVSVINIVLAVGLSVDYSAHVGHCFMVKGGTDKNRRALESLADIGAAVLSGATSTFLAVVVLLFSSSYVFSILSKQFALTVVLGVLHGLVLLPVVLSILGPKPFSSAEDPELEDKKATARTDNIQGEEASSEESSKQEEEMEA